MENNKTQITKSLEEKIIIVSREFNAPLKNVWKAFTESKILEQWWAPQPWKAEIKEMNFSVGGYWLYAMVGPESEKHRGKMEYTRIEPLKGYDFNDMFCDEEGKTNEALPVSKGQTTFTKTNNGILVELKTTFPSEKDVQTTIDM